jgi:hypothetical protein
MTSIRLTATQKQKLAKASRVLQAILGRRVSQGRTVEFLADFALRNRALLARWAAEKSQDLEGHPFFDASFVFDLGPTDESTHDRVFDGKH